MPNEQVTHVTVYLDGGHSEKREVDRTQFGNSGKAVAGQRLVAHVERGYKRPTAPHRPLFVTFLGEELPHDSGAFSESNGI